MYPHTHTHIVILTVNDVLKKETLLEIIILAACLSAVINFISL